ncbi:MAG: TolC family protein [Myxococcota bacterium]
MLAASLLSLMIASPFEGALDPKEPLTIEAATEYALKYSLDMFQARQDVLLVDADYATVLSVIMPSVDLSINAGGFHWNNRIIETRDVAQSVRQPNELPTTEFGPFRDFRSGSFTNSEFGLQLSAQQLIYDGGRWWTAISLVRDRKEASKETLRAVENSVRAAVARAFYGLERARRSTEAIDAQVEVDRAQVKRAKAMLQIGRGAPNDVVTALRNLASDRSTLIGTQTAEGQANRALNLVIGRRIEIENRIVMPPSVASSTAARRYVPGIQRLKELAQNNRPELQSARLLLDAARKEITMERGDYYPAVSMFATYNRNSRRPDRIFDDPSNNFTANFGFSMAWNLFRGLSTNAAVQRAQINMRKLQGDYVLLERQAMSEVADSLQRLKNQERTLQEAIQQIDAAEEAVRLARGLYEAGRGTSLELRDAELGLTRARLARVNAILDAAIAHADLVQAVGSAEWATQESSAKPSVVN